MRMTRAGVFAGLMAGLLVAVGGCAGIGQAPSATPGQAPENPAAALPAPTETITHGGTGSGRPASFVVRYDATELQLAPSSWCYTTDGVGTCADGFDDDPPSIGSPEEVLVFVPVPEFTSLTVTQFSGNPQSPDAVFVEAPPEDLGGGWWRLVPVGPAGDYWLELFAGGDGAGSMSASLRWTTTSDEPVPTSAPTSAATPPPGADPTETVRTGEQPPGKADNADSLRPGEWAPGIPSALQPAPDPFEARAGAAWSGDPGVLWIVTWGSSSCPLVVDSVTILPGPAPGPNYQLSFVPYPAQTPCTADLAPTTSAVQWSGGSEATIYLFLDGIGTLTLEPRDANAVAQGAPGPATWLP
jgi:hypothetical protein